MSFRDKFPVLAYWLGRKRYILSTLFYRKNPRKWTEKQYKKKFSKSLDLENPKTFYEKINYWKLFYNNPKQTLLADKLAVKDYLKDLGYGDLCAKTLFVTKNIKELRKWIEDNSATTKRFAIKTNHSCGDVYIFDNGAITKKNGRKIKNLRKVLKMLKMGLKYNHYYTYFEKPYKDIEPKAFVEECILFDESTVEYEFMCNYSNIIATKVVTNRQNKNHTAVTVDSDFNVINCDPGCQCSEKVIKKPANFALMKEIINKTTQSFPFCRVDFIECNGKPYFCEFTFIKSGGMDIYQPEPFNNELGDKFKL